MKAYSKRTQKQMILDAYNELREEAIKEVSTDVMRQTAALLLFSMSITEDNKYSKEELQKIYKEFISFLHMPSIFGKQLDTDTLTKQVEDKLGIDLNLIDTQYRMELTK